MSTEPHDTGRDEDVGTSTAPGRDESRGASVSGGDAKDIQFNAYGETTEGAGGPDISQEDVERSPLTEQSGRPDDVRQPVDRDDD